VADRQHPERRAGDRLRDRLHTRRRPAAIKFAADHQHRAFDLRQLAGEIHVGEHAVDRREA